MTTDAAVAARPGTAERQAPDAAGAVTTPTVRQAARGIRFWVAIGVVVLLLALGSIAVVGGVRDLPRLAADSPAPDGAMAVAEVLRQQGVDVTATTTFAATEKALSGDGDTTLVVFDPDDNLDEEKRSTLSHLTGNLILLEPGFDLLREVAPAVSAAGSPDDDPLTAACPLPEAENAGEVSPGGTSYRVAADDAQEVDTCLASSSENAPDAYSLLRLETSGTTVTVVGATDAITNGEVLENGNAAYALTLLGSTARLVWYLPSLADVLGASDAGLLTPGWVTPTIVLIAVVALAAAVWRGRRFGPLIVENLPVVVRASETMEGRARLYQRSSARLRAIDALRVGALGRLARSCGLSSTATVEEVGDGVSAAVKADPRVIRSLLVEAEPGTDAELVRLSDGLADLEAATAKAVRP